MNARFLFRNLRSLETRDSKLDRFENERITYLLQGNSPLEISRLFGWQSTNELALKAGRLGFDSDCEA